MPDVFINYRTGDGEKTATVLDTALSARFGDERVFRASKSIRPGTLFPAALRKAVRSSSVLIAVIGQDWARHPGLRDAEDWVRQEILEAFEYGIEVLPVLDGRTTDRLSKAALPKKLQRIADLNSLRFDHQNAQADLTRIGDALAELVPQLAAADTSTARVDQAAPVRNSLSGGTQGTVVQTGDFTGTVGTSLHGTRGPVHTGRGDQYVGSQHFSGTGSGAGATYVAGDLQGGIRHRFDRTNGTADDEQ